MNAAEATDLLTLIAATENRSEVNAAQALSWSFALEDVPVDVARAALKDLWRASGEQYPGRITPQTLRKYAGPHLARLARNVRSAKLRGLVPADWPETTPLPPAAAERLRAEFDATNDVEALPSAAPTTRKELRP